MELSFFHPHEMGKTTHKEDFNMPVRLVLGI